MCDPAEWPRTSLIPRTSTHRGWAAKTETTSGDRETRAQSKRGLLQSVLYTLSSCSLRTKRNEVSHHRFSWNLAARPQKLP